MSIKFNTKEKQNPLFAVRASKNLLALATFGSILLAYGQHPVLAADLVTGTPLQTIHSKFGDPLSDPAANPNWLNKVPVNYDSPDGSDIVYLGTNSSTTPTAGVLYRNTLLLCDGEVDEMAAASWAQLSSPPGFSGFNLFEMNLTGSLLNIFSTTNSARTGWSNEPVGCSFNPNNGHLFISDDDQRLVFEINPGSDGQLFTADDTRTSFSTSAFGNNDPEGLAYNPVDGALYVVNGVDSEIHKILPGANGRFDGVPPSGDDVATHFDVLSQGVTDPEGIAFDADNRLYVVGKPQTRMAHIYTSGPLVRSVDLSAFNYPFGPRKPAGLAVGPNGTVFISARGVDNNADPNENDGQVHEVSVPDLGTPPPAVAAGPDLTVFMPNNVQLKGAAVNAGSTTWSQVSGPGSTTFANPDAVVTTASFTSEGIYVLSLSDNSSTAYDEVTIQVRRPTNGFGTIYASPLLSTKVPVNPDDPNSSKMSVANEDIIAYNTVTRTWSLFFDGSKVGLGATGVNVDAFKVMEDGSILLSLDVPVTLPISDPSIGSVIDTLIDDSDIVRFVPTALGANTAGSFQWFFDGSDVGLDTDSEDIDSIGFLPSGKLVVSLTGSGAVPGISTVQDEDLIAFTASDLGLDTGGTWSMHFDGSDVGLSDGGDGEDVMGAWFDSNNADSSNIYLSTKGDFSVPGATGDGADILKCTPSSIGTTTACSYAFTWDGGGNGISVGVILDGIDLVPSQPDSDTTPPSVSMTAPTDNATVSGTVTVSADAADNVGVVGVQFQIDGNPLGVEITGSGPYAFAWDTSISGVYSLTAVARDAAGNLSTSGSITVTVDNGPPPDTLPPNVTLTAPSSGATISGTVTVSADATDNVGVAGVQFLLDGSPLGAEITGSGPYAFAWDTAASDGGHSLTAVARDAAGNTATSGSITVSVDKGSPPDTTPPGVTLTAPAADAIVSGTVTVSADATDNVGVAGVQFLLDGSPLGAEITGSGPYAFAWDTTATDGGHSLTAVARDAAGNTATSGGITVTVDNGPPPDTLPPNVTLTAPAAGSIVSGTVTVSADAADNVGVAGVQFLLDGSPLGAEITGSGPYAFAWDTSAVPTGGHNLAAVARDAAGNTATSTTVSVTVNNTLPVDGLTHQWKFDETSGATAANSIGTNTATLNNSSWVTGKTGNAASFNGANASADAGKIDFGTGNFTVAHWVNVNGFKNFAGIFNNRSSASGNIGFHTRTDGTSTIAALIDFGATSKSLTVTNAVAGTWYHIAVSVDRTGLMKLYVNAVLAGQVDISAFGTTSITNTDNVRLGRDQASNYFNGALDELHLYNKALSAAEIVTLYNQ